MVLVEGDIWLEMEWQLPKEVTTDLEGGIPEGASLQRCRSLSEAEDV
jgi:hypothetical protein